MLVSLVFHLQYVRLMRLASQACTTGTGQVLVQAVLDETARPPVTGAVGCSMQAVWQLRWESRQGWWLWRVPRQTEEMHLVLQDYQATFANAGGSRSGIQHWLCLNRGALPRTEGSVVCRQVSPPQKQSCCCSGRSWWVPCGRPNARACTASRHGEPTHTMQPPGDRDAPALGLPTLAGTTGVMAAVDGGGGGPAAHVGATLATCLRGMCS